MSVGTEAAAAGYPLVPDTGETGRVRWGAREINRTRDFVAQIKSQIAATPAARRTAAGISSGTANPTGGSNGDIYFKII